MLEMNGLKKEIFGIFYKEIFFQRCINKFFDVKIFL